MAEEYAEGWDDNLPKRQGMHRLVYDTGRHVDELMRTIRDPKRCRLCPSYDREVGLFRTRIQGVEVVVENLTRALLTGYKNAGSRLRHEHVPTTWDTA